MSSTSDLARELGAIASGEARHAGRLDLSDAFATGLTRLINESIAAAFGAVPHNPPMDAGAIYIGSCFRWVGGAYDGEIGEVTAGPFGPVSSDREWRLMTNGATQTFFASVLMDRGYFTHEPSARPVRAADVAAKDPGHVEPYRVPTPSDAGRPVDATGVGEGVSVVAVGDTFLRLTAKGRFIGGEVCTVDPCWQRRADGGADAVLHGSLTCRTVGRAWEAIVSDVDLLTSGDWQRVPSGYVLPTVTQCLAEIRKLVDAYKAMLRDPETGAAGVDATVRQMATMAGLEVPA